MAAYNAEAFIAEAIGSAMRQSFGNWELIVVDDASTDRTGEIVASLADSDPRIRYVRLPENTGTCNFPRLRATELARTELVSQLDADDLLPPDYLATLMQRKHDTGADIVYPQMWTFGSNPSDARRILPDPEAIDESRVYNGRELFRHTLDGWKISLSGGLVPRSIYLEAARRSPLSPTLAHSDEYISRTMLAASGAKVAFAQARYLYRVNPESLSRAPGISRFDILDILRELTAFSLAEYGAGSEEHILAHAGLHDGIIDCIRLLTDPLASPATRRLARPRVAAAMKAVDRRLIKGRVGPRYHFLLGLPLPLAEAAERIAGLMGLHKGGFASAEIAQVKNMD